MSGRRKGFYEGEGGRTGRGVMRGRAEERNGGEGRQGMREGEKRRNEENKGRKVTRNKIPAILANLKCAVI